VSAAPVEGGRGVLAALVAGRVAFAEAFAEAREVALLAGEEVAVARAVDRRRREFASGRACARRALAQLGLEPVAIPAGRHGEPRWPPGVVGSITHCAHYRACAVAHARDVATLGVDAEPHEGLTAQVRAMIAREEEVRMLDELAERAPAVHWDRLLFSAKEATYKAWFPLTGRWLGFEDASVTLDPDRGSFVARLLVPGPVVDGAQVAEFAGRWLVRGGLVITAVAQTRVASLSPGGARGA